MGTQFRPTLGARVVAARQIGVIKIGACGKVTDDKRDLRYEDVFSEQRVTVFFDEYPHHYIVHASDLAPEPKPARAGQFVKGGGRALLSDG